MRDKYDIDAWTQKGTSVFPSPCGVRRVRDDPFSQLFVVEKDGVSVPLRGKEGAGRLITISLIR